MADNSNPTVSINAQSASELLAARIAAISEEADQSSAPSAFAQSVAADPFGGVPLLSEQTPTRSGEQLPTRESFEQTYLQSLINTGQSEAVASILNASPKQQEAQLAGAYQAEIARLQSSPLQVSPVENALVPSSQYSQHFLEPERGLSRLPGFAEELLGDKGEDFLQQSLSARLSGQSLTENRHALTQRFTRISDDISPSGIGASPGDDVLPDPLDLGYGDDNYAQRRTLSPDSFAVSRGPSGFQKIGSGARRLMGRAGENMREDFADPSGYGKLNYGYALQQLGHEGGELYEKTNSGNYLTPEQSEAANAGLLPGIGAVAGTLIGSMVAPGVGSWVGGMIGAGVGSAAQGIVGANEERAQSVRETGNIFGTETGASTAAIKEFTEALSHASAATKEVQAAFTTLSGAGPGVGGGTLPGVEFMSGALGERYNPALSGLTHALSSDPVLRSLQPALGASGGNFGGGMAGAQQLGDIATAEAFSGDWQASGDAATLAEGSLTNTQYAADMNRHSSAFTFGGAVRLLNPIGQLTHPFQNAQDIQALERLWTGQDDQYIPGAEAEKARIAKDRAEAYGLYADGASAEEVAKTGVGLAGSRLAIAENQGATDAQLSGVAQGLYSAVAASVPKLTQEAAGIDGYLDAHPNMDAATRLKMQKTRDGVLTEAYGMEQEQSQTVKALFGRSLETEESGFSLGETRATYSGQSITARAGIYQDQERFLTGVADNPGPLSPAERNAVRQNVIGMQRGFQQGALAEEESGFGLSITRGMLSGRTAASLEGDYDRQASHLQSFAESPLSLLSRAERSGLEENADQMRYGAKLATFTQALSRDDAGIEQSALGVTQAKNFGTPSEVYSAQSSEIDSLTGKMRELTHQLSAGGLSADDFTAKMRQRTEVESQAAQVMAQRRDDRLNAGDSLASSQMGIDTAGLSHAVRTGGAGAADYDTLSRDYAQTFAADQARIDAFKPGDPRRQAAQAKLAGDRASSREYEDSLEAASPFSARVRTESIRGDTALDSARQAFDRDMKNPYQDGNPNNSPFTAGRKVEGLIDASLARNDRNEAAETAYRAGLQGKKGADGKPLWDDLSEEKYVGDQARFQQRRDNLLGERADIEEKRRTGLIEMLPEMIAGSPGQGRLSGILPTSGQAAYYNPNQFISGTFGPLSRSDTYDGQHHTPQAGGSVGAFLAAGFSEAGGAGAMHGDSGAAILAELKRLNANIERGSMSTGRTPFIPQRGNLNAYRADGLFP